jgi:hypothetical protein
MFRDSIPGVEVLLQKGYLFARRGVTAEFPRVTMALEDLAMTRRSTILCSSPLSATLHRNGGFQDLVWAADQAENGIAVFNSHCVPYPRAPRVSVDTKVFSEYMKYLRDQKCTVIAMRDLIKICGARAPDQTSLFGEKRAVLFLERPSKASALSRNDPSGLI